MTRLCVGFSHLRERKFKHNFQDTLNPLCPCSLEAEGKYHFFMHYQIFPNQRNVLFDHLNAYNLEILKMSENEIVRILFFDNKSFTKHISLRTITSSIIQYIFHYIITLLHYYIYYYYVLRIIKNITYLHSNKNLKYFFTICGCILCNLSPLKSKV